ncbi:MAG: biosynthetic arginine decarboxylase [Deltaproteobacteria bacterium]|nr:biosynthetic arginine decarboxylase [Deltaproteobacteria bacterium]
MEGWDVQKSANLYGIGGWGENYFDINQQGEVVVRPSKNSIELNVPAIVKELTQRGIQVPILLRFDGIIRDRVTRLCSAFSSAISEFSYQGKYRGVFPIKVNQQRHVVDVLRASGREFGLGLEVGSKPELVAVMAMHDTPGALLLCNGYKDREYIELALLARKLGRRTIIIVEQFSEVEQTIQVSKQLGIEPELGLRLKPSSRGAGKWESSGGDNAKFGLSTTEIVAAINILKKNNCDHWLKLVHFHVGSQISSIAAIKKVLREATRMYTGIAKLCPSLCLFDAGGGLAVDYDGSKTNFAASMDYSVEEYARDIVYAIRQACDDVGVPHPDIVTESGRALVAHHAVLVAQIVDVAHTLDVISQLDAPPSDRPRLAEFQELYQNVTIKNCRETLHDAVALRDEINELFMSGEVSLEERAYADRSFWHLMAKLKRISSEMKFIPEEFEKLGDELKDTYFINFSVFQSLPDAWAIDQLFPIMPIHRLKEEPTRRCMLGDMSCDSDGVIDKFVDLKDVKNHLSVHALKSDEPYYIATFLVGAYQEILGDLHNLFGDTNAVHIDVDANGQMIFTDVVEGDTIREVLSYVQYDPPDLLESMRQAIERSLREGSITSEESARIQKRYREVIDGYTYLVVDP